MLALLPRPPPPEANHDYVRNPRAVAKKGGFMEEYARIIAESPAEDAAEALADECRRKDAIIGRLRDALVWIQDRDKDWEARDVIKMALTYR